MLERIEIKHFKCFKDLSLPLAQLTLLSGANASGKSSILQTLVLLQQTMREHEWSSRLMLNGNSIRLGAVTDVVDKVNGRHGFELLVNEEHCSVSWKFAEEERWGLSMNVEQIRVNGTEAQLPSQLQYLVPSNCIQPAKVLADRLRRLTYMTAERVGPRDTYPLVDLQTAELLDPVGRYAVSLMYLTGHQPVLEELRLPDVSPTRLSQINARMDQFFPGCELVIQTLPQTNALTLGVRTSEDTNFHRPVHVGFGLTQILPIIVAALSASRGDLLLIENPEVHLHPKGQAMMGTFLGEVAKAGVQVIIETHSDHVLNGIRRAVKGGMPPEKVALYFFRPRMGDAAQIVNPRIDAHGNIDDWPEGFFDQFDKDMNYFAGWGE